MKKLLLIGLLILALGFTVKAGATEPSVEADKTCAGKETTDCSYDCPDGYFWRGGCVRVTGCPYGDSIPMEMCDKFKPEEPKEEVRETPVEVEETPVFEGK